MSTERGLVFFEFVLWVLTVSALVVAVTLPLGVLIGGDLVAAKFGLFLVGLCLFGIGSIAIQPEGPNLEGSVYDSGGQDQEETNGLGGSVIGGGPSGPADAGGGSEDVQTDRQLGLETRLQEVGPLAGRHLPYDRRVGRRYKIFATGIVVLAVSYLLEVLGVSI